MDTAAASACQTSEQCNGTADIGALRDALLWAAGSEAASFRLRPEQYDDFLAAMKLHRLSGRLVRRLQRDATGPAQQLLDEAVRSHEAVKREAFKKIELAGRLGKALRESGGDEYVVLLKGFTLYALTGDPLHLRPMGDLDLNVADLDGFVGFAMRHGFQLARPLDHLAEYAVLLSPTDGAVELHSRFDVTSISREAAREELAPGLHAGVWEQRQHFRVRYLRHRDFQEHLAASSVVSDSVRPLRAEMAALIHASHLFKNFLRCPYPLPIATVPLDEVATFVDLCRLPSFDATRFAALIDRFDGGTAVSFASALAKDLLGADALPRNGNDRLFPINMWWDGLDGGGFPVDVGWDPQQLVYRDRPMRHLVDALGGLEISTLGPTHTASFRLLDGASKAGAKRYIFRKDRDSTFVVDCDVSLGSRGLLLKITMPRIRDDRMVAIAVCFQDYRYEIFLNCRVRDPFFDYSMRQDAVGEVVVNRHSPPDADIVELGLPSQVVGNCGMDGYMYGFIVIREQIREWSRMTAGAAVPLRIRLPE